MICLLHFNLKNPIMVGKKKTQVRLACYMQAATDMYSVCLAILDIAGQDVLAGWMMSRSTPKSVHWSKGCLLDALGPAGRMQASGPDPHA